MVPVTFRTRTFCTPDSQRSGRRPLTTLLPAPQANRGPHETPDDFPAAVGHDRRMIRFGHAVAQDVDVGLNKLVSLLAADPRVEVVWLFGSRARGEHDALSDVDLAVLASPNASKEQLFDWSIDWTNAAVRHLGTDEVAVQPINRIPLALRHGILRDARVLWQRRPYLAADYEVHTTKRYLDLEPHLRRYDNELFQQAATGTVR